jgi:small-conductance mechanosensitive channel
MVLASFWSENNDWITAVVTLAVAVGIAQLIDHAITHRGGRLAEAMPGELSPTASTRLRLVRRLVYALIIVIGIAIALSQFEGIKRLAAAVLASSAVLGLIVGFAARAVLANAVAGVMLAITQPIRIGDLVTFEEETGVIEDVRLTYTYVKTSDGRRIIIPNERLAQNIVQNHTIVDARVRVEVDVWINREVDAIRAVSVLRSDSDVDVTIAEIDKEGVRLVAGTWARNAAERGPIAAGLRASCLERLQSAGLSSVPAE